MGPRYLEDLLDTMGTYVDGLKFAGGSFSLMPRDTVRQLIEICHAHDVLVKNYGPDVNLFVDYSQIVQLECLRSGIWGTKDVWGRIKMFKE